MCSGGYFSETSLHPRIPPARPRDPVIPIKPQAPKARGLIRIQVLECPVRNKEQSRSPEPRLNGECWDTVTNGRRQSGNGARETITAAATCEVSAQGGANKILNCYYRKISNIRRTKSPNFNLSCLVLQLSWPSSMKPVVKWRMKM